MHKFPNEIAPYIALVTRLGLTMIISILACFGAGLMIDKFLSTNGLFLILGTIIGVCGGFYLLYKQIMETDFGKNQDD